MNVKHCLYNKFVIKTILYVILIEKAENIHDCVWHSKNGHLNTPQQIKHLYFDAFKNLLASSLELS